MLQSPYDFPLVDIQEYRWRAINSSGSRMNKKNLLSFRSLLLALILLLLVNIALLLLLQPRSSPMLEIILPQNSPQTPAMLLPSGTPAPQPTCSALQPEYHLPTLPADISPAEGLRLQGVFILSMTDGNYKHLFAYHPQFLALTRLTNTQGDDVSPAASPDGKKILFSSNRNGYWNLYLLHLEDGQISQLTDTPQYDGSPVWSPDSQWIAYESYTDNNLDIYVRSTIDLSQEPIRLTDDDGTDHSPAWSPQGREIAFVSNRSGDEEIWIAQLDQVDDRFTNVSRSPGSREFHPAWSPDGETLAWASGQPDANTLMLWDRKNPEGYARPVGIGDWPVWNPAGGALATVVKEPNVTSLAAYHPSSGQLFFPLSGIPASIHGIEWSTGETVDLLAQFPLPPGASEPLPKLWTSILSINPPPPGNRFGVNPVNDVTAPFPFLHDEVDESFDSLRQEIANEAGWDFLSSLQNAYLPLTEPPNPEMIDNWLYTGRAIAVNPMALYAGWMAISKEDYSGQTYWRIFLKARYQDGSAGTPLKEQPWDINARFTGDPRVYDQGGRLMPAPPGYWIDLTEIALRYGWERIPARVNWRSYYDAARFNIFVLRNGLDWQTALNEIYPPEALITPTYQPTRTPTITLTPENFDKLTITPTLTASSTPTLRPTWTPQP